MKALARVTLCAFFCLLVPQVLSAEGRTSSSQVNAAATQVKVDPATGHTAEQDNLAGRLHNDNLPGAVKHLYVIGYKSGTIVLYSTVRGKVTSSGKRLTPVSTIAKYNCGDDTCFEGQRVYVGDKSLLTTEITQDDGTYGSSSPYIYWFDSQGRYHQHFFTEGQVIAITDQPLKIKGILFNAEIAASPKQ